MFQNQNILTIERPCLKVELPFARRQLRKNLADAAFPVGKLSGSPVPSEGVNVHDRKCSILHF